MKAIYKYDVPVADEFKITMPCDAEILCVQVQTGIPRIWALVSTDVDAPKTEKAFLLFGTGLEVFNEGRYVGSFQLVLHGLVFHLFQDGRS